MLLRRYLKDKDEEENFRGCESGMESFPFSTRSWKRNLIELRTMGSKHQRFLTCEIEFRSKRSTFSSGPCARPVTVKQVPY